MKQKSKTQNGSCCCYVAPRAGCRVAPTHNTHAPVAVAASSCSLCAVKKHTHTHTQHNTRPDRYQISALA
jgi:hypothetical protein